MSNENISTALIWAAEIALHCWKELAILDYTCLGLGKKTEQYETFQRSAMEHIPLLAEAIQSGDHDEIDNQMNQFSDDYVELHALLKQGLMKDRSNAILLPVIEARLNGVAVAWFG